MQVKQYNMEIFKDVIGYEGKYFVSNLGNIKSSPKTHRRKEIILKTMPLKGGYLTVDLCKDKLVTKTLVHRIVANAFIPNPENKPQVNHINGNKQDNRVENLEWVTHSENQLHSIKIGIRTTKGEKNSQSKLRSEQVLEILKDNRLYKFIAADYGISIYTVSDIKRGYSWTHITNLKNLKKVK